LQAVLVDNLLDCLLPSKVLGYLQLTKEEVQELKEQIRVAKQAKAHRKEAHTGRQVLFTVKSGCGVGRSSMVVSCFPYMHAANSSA